MDIIDIDLKIDYKRAGIPTPKIPCRFTGFVPKQYMSGIVVKRPAIIIFPGGAYRHISARENTPVAMEYLAKGYCAFVLSYTVAPNGYFPSALLEAFSAISYIREHAEQFDVDPDKITVCGFSAGGHAAAAAGILWNHEIAQELGFKQRAHRPDAMVLCYPVITAGHYTHKESLENLLGENCKDQYRELVSLENQVDETAPRTFIWHTASDKSVPVQNTLLLADALVRNGVETEVHIYPRGEHGLSTARFDVMVPGRFEEDSYVINSVPDWISDSIRFLNI